MIIESETAAMKPDDVQVGETYRVHIPRRDRPINYFTNDPARTDVDIALSDLYITRANDFDITVTAVGQLLGDEPAVTGVRVTETARVSTPLDPQVAEALGLPADVDYVVDGVLRDAATGEIVALPADQTVTVPARWLR